MYFPGAGPLETERSFTSDIEDKAPSFNACPRGRWLKNHSSVKTQGSLYCINNIKHNLYYTAVNSNEWIILLLLPSNL